MRSTRWGAGLLMALLLTALPAAYDATDAAASGRPSVGECRTLTFRQLGRAANTTAPVPCTDAHNDRVIKVADLPSGTTWDGLTTAQVLRLGVTECAPVFHRALGQNDKVRDRTAYSWVFFAPTQSERSSGANWIRCDLILLKAQSLVNLPTDDVPALTSATPSHAVRRCATGKLHLTTVCSAPHDFRSTGAFTVKGSYPGARKLAGIARHRCPALVSTPGRFLFAHPNKLTWNLAHDHAVVCFSHRSS